MFYKGKKKMMFILCDNCIDLFILGDIRGCGERVYRESKVRV